VTEAGEEIAPNDPNWDDLQTRSAQTRTNPMAWIGMEQVYGALAQNAGFVAHFAEALAFIWAHGVDAALKRYIEKKREFRPR
jgi:mannitol 2-dehydrogenase